MIQKKVFIKTFGCQMNEYDSNRIYDTVKNIGYIRNDDQNDVDCYILNTCHIRDKAKEKVYHEIGRVKKSFRGKKKPIVVVAGNRRISNTFALVAEYWLPPEVDDPTDLPLAISARFIGRNIAVDVGALLLIDMPGIPLPLINFTYHME